MITQRNEVRATCGVCGADRPIGSKEQAEAFETAHERTCGPDAPTQYDCTIEDLPW